MFPSARTARRRTASSATQSAELNADTARATGSRKVATASQPNEKKGRPVTYDLDGTAVPLEPVPPEKLPPYSHTPNVSVKNETAGLASGGTFKQNGGGAYSVKRPSHSSVRKSSAAPPSSGGSSKPRRSSEADSQSDAASRYSYFRAAHSLGAGMSPTSPSLSTSPSAVVQSSQAMLQAPSTVSDEELAQSPMWESAASNAGGGGAVSLPVLPDKPGTRQRQMATGLFNLRNPRDRVHPAAKKNTSDYAHLPPPPVGQTAGHGFVQKPSRQPISSSQAGSNSFSKGLDSPHSTLSSAGRTPGIITQVSPAVVKHLLS